jgi:anti-sigma regulatory factor (Ser/Thr protein kinase)
MQAAQQWVLPKEPTSPGLARRHLRSSMTDVPADLLDIALLLTSELVTNAVKYGGENIVLVLADEARLLRVEVRDDGRHAPRIGAAENHDLGGRGLLLVESLASEWGTSPADHEPGKAVWFILRKPS